MTVARPAGGPRDGATGRAAARVSATRLAVAVRLDIRLQRRYGLWGATAVVAVVWVVLLRLVPPTARGTAGLLVVFLQMAVVGYTFAGAQVLLEKGERSLTAVAVTPLRVGEYVAAKVASLGLLSLAASVAVVAAGGVPVAAVPLLAGVAGLSVLGLLAGLAAVAPFASLTRWLFPSVGPLLALALPLVTEFGVRSPALWLLPTYGPYRLLDAAFGERAAILGDPVGLLGDPAGLRVLVAAVAVTVAWAALLGVLAKRRFERMLRDGEAG